MSALSEYAATREFERALDQFKQASTRLAEALEHQPEGAALPEWIADQTLLPAGFAEFAAVVASQNVPQEHDQPRRKDWTDDLLDAAVLYLAEQPDGVWVLATRLTGQDATVTHPPSKRQAAAKATRVHVGGTGVAGLAVCWSGTTYLYDCSGETILGERTMAA